MTRKKRLIILGPSFRRNTVATPLPAIQRYDGIFFRITRKYLDNVKDVDVVVMLDDLSLVDGDVSLQYVAPKGEQWRKQTFTKEAFDRGKALNDDFLFRKFRNDRYSVVFIAMGKKYAKALPDMSKYGIEVIFPNTGGLGPKARALKEWIHGGYP